MTATAIIIITCLLLHRSGVINKILTACKVQELETEAQPEPAHPPEEGRQKWETEAAYILKRQGMDPDTVQYMGDEMLINIIREYLDI